MKKLLLLSLPFILCHAASFSQDLLKNKESAHAGEILCAAINNDGSAAVTGGMDKRMQVWNVMTGEKIKIFTQSAAITACAFNASGKLFATGSADGKLIIFNAIDWKIVKIIKAHTLAITSISWNETYNTIATCSKDNTTLEWYDWEMPAAYGPKSFDLTGHSKPVNVVAYSPGGKGRSIATGSEDNTVKIWKDAQMKTTFDGGARGITGLAWSSDGKYIVSGSSTGAIIVWDAASGTKLAETDFKFKVNSIAISPDVQYLAVAGENKKISIWNIETKQIVKEFDAHEKDITAIAFSDANNIFISASTDGSFKIWDTRNLKIGKKKFMKDVEDPKLSVISLNLKDDNQNGIIENPEKPSINFIVKNQGKGLAYNLIAKVSIDNSVVGLNFSKEISIGNLDADKYTNVSIPITTDSALETTAGVFTIELIDANGFTAPQQKINFQSRGGASYSYVMVTSHSYSSATGKAETGAPITLRLKFKNTSSGEAKNVKLNYIFPPNVMAVNKLSELIPTLRSGEEKETSVEFYVTKEFTKPKVNIGLNLEGGYTNANDLVFEIKMNEALPTTDIAVMPVTAQAESYEHHYK